MMKLAQHWFAFYNKKSLNESTKRCLSKEREIQKTSRGPILVHYQYLIMLSGRLRSNYY